MENDRPQDSDLRPTWVKLEPEQSIQLTAANYIGCGMLVLQMVTLGILVWLVYKLDLLPF